MHIKNIKTGFLQDKNVTDNPLRNILSDKLFCNKNRDDIRLKKTIFKCYIFLSSSLS